MHLTRVGIAGLGLIGGSIGMALRECSFGAQSERWHVTGYDTDPEACRLAIGVGAVDSIAPSLQQLAADADLLIVAAPTTQIAGTVLLASQHARVGTTITDCGSVKAEIMARIEAELPDGVSYIGGHPMAGSESRGVSHADPHLFRNAPWALCDSARRPASGSSWRLVESFVQSLGAVPLRVDATEHDRGVAFTSHLQYVVSVVLALACHSASERSTAVTQLMGRAFRDMTRVARADPSGPLDYCLLNRQELNQAIMAFSAALSEVSGHLAERDDSSLLACAHRARDFLHHLNGQPQS